MQLLQHRAAQARHKGFTLLEVLLVVAIIAILAGIVIVAINPNKQLGDTRNTQRWADVNTILNAVYQYSIDNNGTLPTIPSSATPICNTTGVACTTGGFVDLGVVTALETYVTAIPVDPQCTTTDSACYTILKSANDRITIAAPDAESSATITVTK